MTGIEYSFELGIFPCEYNSTLRERVINLWLNSECGPYWTLYSKPGKAFFALGWGGGWGGRSPASSYLYLRPTFGLSLNNRLFLRARIFSSFLGGAKNYETYEFRWDCGLSFVLTRNVVFRFAMCGRMFKFYQYTENTREGLFSIERTDAQLHYTSTTNSIGMQFGLWFGGVKML